MASMTFTLILITFKEIFSFYCVPNLQSKYLTKWLSEYLN